MSDELPGGRAAIREQIDQLAPIAAGLHRLCPEIIRLYDEFGSPSFKYNRPRIEFTWLNIEFISVNL